MKFLLRYLIIHYNKSIILYDISYITTILSLSNYFEKNEKYYYSTTLPTGWYFAARQDTVISSVKNIKAKVMENQSSIKTHLPSPHIGRHRSAVCQFYKAGANGSLNMWS